MTNIEYLSKDRYIRRLKLGLKLSAILPCLMVAFHKVHADEILFSPIFNYGDFQTFDEITNLSQSDNLSLEPTGEHGYKVFSFRKYYLTAGVQVVSSVLSSTGYVSAGLAPVVNTYTKWQLHFANKKSLEEFSYEIPIKKEAFLALNKGDAVYWNSNAGLVLNVSAGAGGVGVGPKLSLEGGHSVYLERKTENEFYLELRRNKLFDASLLAGSFIGYASYQYLVEKTAGLSFLIDVSKSGGADRLQEILQEGKIGLVLTDSGITSENNEVRIGDVSTIKKLKGATFSLGTPFYPLMQFKKGKTQELLVEERSNIWNSQTRLESAIALSEKATRVLNKHFFSHRAALAEKLIDLNTGEGELRAQLFWVTKNNRTTFFKLRKYFAELDEKTDVASKVPLMFPEENKHLGTAQLAFQIRPSKKLLLKIIEKNNLEGPKKIAKFMNKIWATKESFKEFYSIVESCGGSWGFEISGKELSRVVRGENFQEDLNCAYLKE